jgi:hypothetical protein
MLPRALALLVLILGSLTAVLGGGYLATQGSRIGEHISSTPAPPSVPVPQGATTTAGQASGAPSASGQVAGAQTASGGADGGLGSTAGGGGGGGGGQQAAPAVAPPPPPMPTYVPPPPMTYPQAPPPAAAIAGGAVPGAAVPGAAVPGAAGPAGAPPTAPPVASGPVEWRNVTVEAGTVLDVQLSQEVSTDSAKPEDKIVARVITPVMAEGVEAIAKDAPVSGSVMLVDKAGAIRGRPRLEWQFETIVVANQKYNIVVPRLFYEGESPLPGATAKVGTGAAGGALVGILLGGKKGALSGAAAGAAGGVTTAMTSPRKVAVLPAGGTFSFRLNAPLKLTVPVPAR